MYQIGGSCIIAPTGEIVAQATTDGDEVIVADMDLDLCKQTNMAKAGWSSYRKIECVRVRLACNVWPYQSIERCASFVYIICRYYSAITAQAAVAGAGETPGMSAAEREQATRDWQAAAAAAAAASDGMHFHTIRTAVRFCGYGRPNADACKAHAQGSSGVLNLSGVYTGRRRSKHEQRQRQAVMRRRRDLRGS